MWADTLLRAEQRHLLQLMTWAGLSVIAATGLAVVLVKTRAPSPLLKQFAAQSAAWGAVVGAIAAVEYRAAALRDLSGAARLERIVWMNVGLDAGYVGIGVTLAFAAWFLARKMSAVGAGLAIVVQGLALLLMHLQFAAVVSR